MGIGYRKMIDGYQQIQLWNPEIFVVINKWISNVENYCRNCVAIIDLWIPLLTFSIPIV